MKQSGTTYAPLWIEQQRQRLLDFLNSSQSKYQEPLFIFIINIILTKITAFSNTYSPADQSLYLAISIENLIACLENANSKSQLIENLTAFLRALEDFLVYEHLNYCNEPMNLCNLLCYEIAQKIMPQTLAQNDSSPYNFLFQGVLSEKRGGQSWHALLDYDITTLPGQAWKFFLTKQKEIHFFEDVVAQAFNKIKDQLLMKHIWQGTDPRHGCPSDTAEIKFNSKDYPLSPSLTPTDLSLLERRSPTLKKFIAWTKAREAYHQQNKTVLQLITELREALRKGNVNNGGTELHLGKEGNKGIEIFSKAWNLIDDATRAQVEALKSHKGLSFAQPLQKMGLVTGDKKNVEEKRDLTQECGLNIGSQIDELLDTSTAEGANNYRIIGTLGKGGKEPPLSTFDASLKDNLSTWQAQILKELDQPPQESKEASTENSIKLPNTFEALQQCSATFFVELMKNHLLDYSLLNKFKLIVDIMPMLRLFQEGQWLPHQQLLQMMGVVEDIEAQVLLYCYCKQLSVSNDRDQRSAQINFFNEFIVFNLWYLSSQKNANTQIIDKFPELKERLHKFTQLMATKNPEQLQKSLFYAVYANRPATAQFILQNIPSPPKSTSIPAELLFTPLVGGYYDVKQENKDNFHDNSSDEDSDHDTPPIRSKWVSAKIEKVEKNIVTVKYKNEDGGHTETINLANKEDQNRLALPQTFTASIPSTSRGHVSFDHVNNIFLLHQLANQDLWSLALRNKNGRLAAALVNKGFAFNFDLLLSRISPGSEWILFLHDFIEHLSDKNKISQGHAEKLLDYLLIYSENPADLPATVERLLNTYKVKVKPQHLIDVIKKGQDQVLKMLLASPQTTEACIADPVILPHLYYACERKEFGCLRVYLEKIGGKLKDSNPVALYTFLYFAAYENQIELFNHLISLIQRNDNNLYQKIFPNINFEARQGVFFKYASSRSIQPGSQEGTWQWESIRIVTRNGEYISFRDIDNSLRTISVITEKNHLRTLHQTQGTYANLPRPTLWQLALRHNNGRMAANYLNFIICNYDALLDALHARDSYFFEAFFPVLKYNNFLALFDIAFKKADAKYERIRMILAKALIQLGYEIRPEYITDAHSYPKVQKFLKDASLIPMDQRKQWLGTQAIDEEINAMPVAATAAGSVKTTQNTAATTATVAPNTTQPLFQPPQHHQHRHRHRHHHHHHGHVLSTIFQSMSGPGGIQISFSHQTTNNNSDNHSAQAPQNNFAVISAENDAKFEALNDRQKNKLIQELFSDHNDEIASHYLQLKTESKSLAADPDFEKKSFSERLRIIEQTHDQELLGYYIGVHSSLGTSPVKDADATNKIEEKFSNEQPINAAHLEHEQYFDQLPTRQEQQEYLNTLSIIFGDEVSGLVKKLTTRLRETAATSSSSSSVSSTTLTTATHIAALPPSNAEKVDEKFTNEQPIDAAHLEYAQHFDQLPTREEQQNYLNTLSQLFGDEILGLVATLTTRLRETAATSNSSAVAALPSSDTAKKAASQNTELDLLTGHDTGTTATTTTVAPRREQPSAFSYEFFFTAPAHGSTSADPANATTPAHGKS